MWKVKLNDSKVEAAAERGANKMLNDNFETIEVVVTNTSQCGTTSALIVIVLKPNTKGLGYLRVMIFVPINN